MTVITSPLTEATVAAARQIIGPEFAVGEHVTICGYSDRDVAQIVKRTPKSITIRRCQQDLLNGPDSGEPDALKVIPGGFSAHTSGVQRWKIGEQFGDEIVCRFKQGRIRCNLGTITLGSHPYYDFNF